MQARARSAASTPANPRPGLGSGGTTGVPGPVVAGCSEERATPGRTTADPQARVRPNPLLPVRFRSRLLARSAFCALLLSTSVHAAPRALQAQGGPELELDWSGGVLGTKVVYSLSGPPGALVAFLPSFSGGPTPLGAFFPGATKELEVGLDLFSQLWIGTLDASGQATRSIPLPASAAFDGLVLHAQALLLNLPGPGLDAVSNPTRFVLSLPGRAHYTLGEMVRARRGHSSTALGDGRVLIAGGEVPGALGLTHASWEIYDPRTQSFEAGGNDMHVGRARHSATLLTDGRVLVAGGIGDGGQVLRSGVVLDPDTGSVQAVAGEMTDPRVWHTATRTANGRVLLAGGSSQWSLTNSAGSPLTLVAPISSTSNYYDPVSNAWFQGPTLPFRMTMHGASLLSDGSLFFAGGYGGPLLFTESTTANTFFLDASGVGWSQGPPLPQARAMFGQTATVDGGALIVGGGEINAASQSLAGVFDSVQLQQPQVGQPWDFLGPDRNWPLPESPTPRCVTDENGNTRYYIIPCPGHWIPWPGPGDAGSPPNTVHALDPGSPWQQVGTLLEERWRAESAVNDMWRLLATGSAGIEGNGTFDRSAEIFTLP